MRLTIQEVSPWDDYMNWTTPVVVWLKAEGLEPNPKEAMWKAAESVSKESVDSSDGLQSEPGTAFCTATNQRFFVFKCNNNGNTYIVSETGIKSEDWGWDGGPENDANEEWQVDTLLWPM